MKEKTTEIYIETHERIVFRQTTAHEIETVCAACQAETVFLAPERAAFFYGLSAREIYRRIESGTIHFLETATGATLVCAASLSMNTGVSTELDLLTTGENYEEPE